MQTVYKYPVQAHDYFEVMMPAGAQVLTVQLQYGDAQMWALVNPDAPQRVYRFRLAGTGHPIEETNLQYIGTFQAMGGGLIFHLFEILLTSPFLIEDKATQV